MLTELVPIQKTGLTLYEIEDNLAALANTFEVIEETEAKQLILDEIGQALQRVKEKRDAVVAFLRHCEAQQTFADQEIERLKIRRERIARFQAEFEQYLVSLIDQFAIPDRRGIKRLEANVSSMRIQKNPDSVVITENPGVYQFALTSDDGSKLYIDDELTVDNDGLHPPQVKMGSVRLSGGIHRIRVFYFQGPGLYIALVLQVAGPGEAWRIFSTEEFKPPPDPETWSYPDADHNAQLRVSSVAGAPGDQVSVEVSIDSPPGRELVTLQWRFIVPAQVLEFVGEGPKTGRAATESGKLLRCSRQKRYLYVCMLAGGQKPIVNGPIAVFHFKIRSDAQPRTTPLRIEKVDAVSSNRRQFPLDSADGTVTIQ